MHFFKEIEDAKKASESALQSPPLSTNTTPDYAAGLTATPSYASVTPAPVVTTTGNVILSLCFLIILTKQPYFLKYCTSTI